MQVSIVINFCVFIKYYQKLYFIIPIYNISLCKYGYEMN